MEHYTVKLNIGPDLLTTHGKVVDWTAVLEVWVERIIYHLEL